MRKLVANIIKTPDGTVLQSFFTHDYKNYKDKNGFTYMVDGGLEYLRRTIITEAPAEELSVYTDDPFALVRRTFNWGTRGKSGNQPLTYKPLIELDTDHIEAIIETQKQVPEHLLNIFKQELQWRKDES
jgi:hypothetical protein